MINLDRFPNGARKALTMSYDDGKYYDRQLIEIFNKYGIKGTFHINAGYLNDKKKDRIQAKLETQMINTGGQLLRKGLGDLVMDAVGHDQAAGHVGQVIQDVDAEAAHQTGA